MKSSLVIISLCLFSCSVTKKSESRTSESLEKFESDAKMENNSITTIEESSLLPVIVPSDSLTLIKNFIFDGIGFSQVMEAKGIRMEASIVPDLSSGLGYKLIAKAVAKGQEVQASSSRKTVIKQADIIKATVKRETASQGSYQRSSKNNSLNVMLVGIALAGLLSGIYLIVKRRNNVKE